MNISEETEALKVISAMLEELGVDPKGAGVAAMCVLTQLRLAGFVITKEEVSE